VKTRREFLVAGGAGLCVLVAPRASLAQKQGKVWRIGFFFFGSRQSALESGRYQAFLQGMRELGYIEGKHFVVEARFADGKTESLAGIAAELMRGNVDVIVATGTPVNGALHKATGTISVVSAVSSDPVGDGFAASHARPGGNITGLTDFQPEVNQKQVELLAACVATLSRLGVLLNPGNPGHAQRLKSVQATAQKVGMRALAFDGGTPDAIAHGFEVMARDRVQAVLVLADSFLLQQGKQIAGLALKYRLPSISLNLEYAKAGGLMSYGPDITDNFRRAAIYVDKILKGAKAGDLPIEGPTKFELILNRKTAKTLGLTIPQSILVRADTVIE
jgi:putative ABC transport system substrate-binding protein